MSSYEEVLLPSSGRWVRVPVDENGKVHARDLAKLLQRKGSPLNDYDERADAVLPVEVTPRQAAAWLDNPDRMDIESIDVQGKPLHNLGARTGERRRIHRKITVYAMPEDEARIRNEFDKAFSIDEQRKMVADGEIVLHARPLKRNVSGAYSKGESTIFLDRDKPQGFANSTVVHEGSHMLRASDKERKGITAAADPNGIEYTGKSTSPTKISQWKLREASNVEESCTVAEEMARAKKFDPSGYYQYVQVYDAKTKRWRNPTQKEAMRMAREDRKLFTNGTNKPLTGKAAVRSVEENWRKSHISRLKLHSKMAISTVDGSAPKPVQKAERKTGRKSRKKSSAGSTKQVVWGRTKGVRTTLYSRLGRRKR